MMETENDMGGKKPQLNFKVRYTLTERLKMLQKKGVVVAPIITILFFVGFVQFYFAKQKGPVDTRSRAETEFVIPSPIPTPIRQVDVSKTPTPTPTPTLNPIKK